MKKVLAWLTKTAKNPVLRPVEVWAIRAGITAVCTWLGIDIVHLVN